MQLSFILLLFAISNAQSQTCTCDLVQGLCEVNCCCDTSDCTVNDTLTFSFCIETEFNPTSFLCAYDQVVFVNNVQTTTRIESDSLFCVQTDNFAERNFYTDPSCIADNTCFNSVGQTYSYMQTVNTVSESLFYQSGDTILVEYTTGVQSIFTIPARGVTNACQDNNPIQFYVDQSSTCTRILSGAASACNTTDSLDYATYFQDFSILSAPFNSSLVSISTASCISSAGFTVTCAAPVYDLTGAICNNAVTDVSYAITTDGLNGIIEAQVAFTLQNITDSDLPLLQTFSVAFTSNQTQVDQVIVRSGNPGYLVGKPLITAVRDQVLASDGTYSVSQNSVPGFEVSLINPASSGICSNSLAQVRLPVVFGSDVRTGCQVQLNGSTCAALQNNIQLFLDGPTFAAFNGSSDVFVGTFGNTDVQSLGTQASPSDWVQVVKETLAASPSNSTSGCAGMVLNSRYEILYANSGSLTNPQPKIVGVRYSYGDPEFIRFQCLRGSCNSVASTQTVEIYTSVNFIDISQTPVSLERQRPTIEAKLPGDFFFPLKSSSAVRRSDVVLISAVLFVFKIST